MNSLLFGIMLTVIGETVYQINPPMAMDVYSQLMAHKTLKWSASGVDYIVPFHSVIKAYIYRYKETVEAPKDANCE